MEMGISTLKNNLLFIYVLFTTLFGMYIIYHSIPQTKIFSCLVMTPDESGNSQKTKDSSSKNGNVQNSSGSSTPAPRADESCLYSLGESDGWFCEYNNDWKRRKRLHQFQDKRNRNDESITTFFEKNWEPTLHCAFEQRLGKAGEGGKWVCDINNIETQNNVPLIYSLGSNGDFTFERDLKKLLSAAEIHIFDSGNFKCPDDICTYHQTAVGNKMISGRKSLKEVMEELDHLQRRMDILKVDIKGNEYKLLEEYFQSSQGTTNAAKLPYIRQILVRIHLPDEKTDKAAAQVHGLFELLRSNHYAIFHKEINPANPNNSAEYGFLRLDGTFFINNLRNAPK